MGSKSETSAWCSLDGPNRPTNSDILIIIHSVVNWFCAHVHGPHLVQLISCCSLSACCCCHGLGCLHGSSSSSAALLLRCMLLPPRSAASVRHDAAAALRPGCMLQPQLPAWVGSEGSWHGAKSMVRCAAPMRAAPWKACMDRWARAWDGARTCGAHVCGRGEEAATVAQSVGTLCTSI